MCKYSATVNAFPVKSSMWEPERDVRANGWRSEEGGGEMKEREGDVVVRN